MEWTFLAFAAFCAMATANAMRPIYWPATLALIAFFFGWLSKELALHQLVIQLGVGAVLLANGGFVAWAGWLGVGLLVTSSVGQLWLHRVAVDSETIVETALINGLGEDYRRKIDDALSDGMRRSFSWRRVLRVFPIRRPSVERIKNVVYCTVGKKKLKMDVYHRNDRPTDCPTLLYVHGGGWVIGNKDQQGLLTVNRLAESGWVCFSLNYRLSPWVAFPDFLIDVKQGIRYIREHGEGYGADPNFLVICGGSAGAHLSTLASLTQNDPTYQPGFEDVDTSIQALVAYYGVYDFTNRHGNWPHYRGFKTLLQFIVMKSKFKDAEESWHAASPMSQLHADVPPIMMLHGDNDALAPISDARQFFRDYQALRNGKPAVFCELPAAQHAFEVFPSIRSLHAVDGVSRFLTTVYSHYLSRAQTETQVKEQRQAVGV